MLNRNTNLLPQIQWKTFQQCPLVKSASWCGWLYSDVLFWKVWLCSCSPTDWSQWLKVHKGLSRDRNFGQILETPSNYWKLQRCRFCGSLFWFLCGLRCGSRLKVLSDLNLSFKSFTSHRDLGLLVLGQSLMACVNRRVGSRSLLNHH